MPAQSPEEILLEKILAELEWYHQHCMRED